MSVWSSEPFSSRVTAILPRTWARSVTAVDDSHRSGMETFSNWSADSAL